MLDRFLIFLLKVTSVAFVIVIVIVFLCSVIIIRFVKWKKRRKKGSRIRRSSHHPHHQHQSHRRGPTTHANDTNQLEGYLVENAETGSTGKADPEDVPPYDHPPNYESLFPSEVSQGSTSTRLLDAMLIVNEVVISPLIQQGSDSEKESPSNHLEDGTSV